MGCVKVILGEDNQLTVQPEETASCGEGLLFESRRCLIALPVILNADGSARHAGTGTVRLKQLSSAGIIRSASHPISELREGDPAAARLEDRTGAFLTTKHRVTPLKPGLSFDTAAYAGIMAWLMDALRRSNAELGTKIAVVGMGTQGRILTRLCEQRGAQTIALDSCHERLDAPAGIKAAHLCGIRQRGIDTVFPGGIGADIVFLTGTVASSELWDDIFFLLRPGGRLVILQEQNITWQARQLPAHPVSADFFLDDRMWDDWHPAERLAMPHGYLRWTTASNLAACAAMLASKQFDTAGVPAYAVDAPLDQPAVFSLQERAPSAAVLLRFTTTCR